MDVDVPATSNVMLKELFFINIKAIRIIAACYVDILLEESIFIKCSTN